MFGVNHINGSVQWLGVPAPLKTYGLPWTDNILASSSACVTGGNYTNPNWLSQPDEPYGIFPSCGVVLPMPCCLTYAGFRKTCAALRAASMTISSKRIVRHACKVSPLLVASSSIVWSIVSIATGVISGMSQLINNLRG